MYKILASDIWNRVDELKKEPLTTLCEKVGIPYTRVKRNRTDCRVPSCEDLLLISKYLNVSIEYLLTGESLLQPLTPEAQAVENDPDLRALVRAVQRDRTLLSAISAVVKSYEKETKIG